MGFIMKRRRFTIVNLLFISAWRPITINRFIVTDFSFFYQISCSICIHAFNVSRHYMGSLVTGTRF